MTELERKDFLQSFFEIPLKELGDLDPQFAGIFIPEPELGIEKVGITDQFLEGAELYHARYSDGEHYTKLFLAAFESANYKPKRSQVILDIGSGPGANTIVPCLRLFEDCRIVATDLSPNLLAILQGYSSRGSLDNRVFCVATDAMKDFFRPACFDVVTGGAILHHLIDPELALRAVHRVLKPGGVAFFFEPFEGCALVRVAFTFILNSEEYMSPRIDEPVRAFLAAMVEDFRVRSGIDKSAPLYRHLDDKWLFTRRYIELAAARVGFRSVIIIPHTFDRTQYRDFVAGLLRITGLDGIGLPNWAWRMIDTFDSALSPELKWDVPLEGTIILEA